MLHNYVMEYKHKGVFNITGRGTVITLDLEENGIPRTKEAISGLMGSEVTYEGNKYKVVGIETFLLPMSHPAYGKHVGLLLKPIQDATDNRSRDNES